MIKENKKTPEIRFPGFTEAWEQRKFSELYEKNIERNSELIGYDKTISIATMTYKDEGNGASDESLKTYKVLRVGDLAFEGHTNKEFRYGRFVVNDIGTGIMSPRFSTLRPLNEMPVSFWKYYIHYEPIMRNVLVNSTKAGTMMNELVIPDFMKQSIMVPSLEEQMKIGEYLDNLDNLITLHQRKCDALQILKKSMLQKMFPKKGASTPEIRFPGFTEAWEQRKLFELGEIMTGSTPSTSKSEYYSADGIPWVTPSDIDAQTISDTPRRLSEEGIKVGRVVPANTILCTCIASIGKNTLLTVKGSFNQQINSLTPNENNDAYFLLTESEIWSNTMKRMAAAGTMQIVNKTEFSELLTMVPKLAEQKKIGEYFHNIDNLITLHQRKCDTLKELKKGMLQKMFV